MSTKSTPGTQDDATAQNARKLLGWAPQIKGAGKPASAPKGPKTLRKLNDSFGVRQGRRSAQTELKLHEIATAPTIAVAWISMALMALLYNASRFQINLAYGVAFLGATSLLASAWIGFLNLRGLRLSTMPTAPSVTAGEVVRFTVVIEEQLNKRRRQLIVAAGEQEFEIALEPHGQVEVQFTAPASHAGRLLAPIIKISTPYPLGIWNVHHLWAPRQEALVWPQPESNAPSLRGVDDDVDKSALNRERPKEGGEGFSMLRSYRKGDSLRRVAWRVFAKTDGQVLATSIGEEPLGSQADLWIDEQAVRDLPAAQQRIARLTAWVMQAHASGRPFGLLAFGSEIQPDSGAEHLQSCLNALALGPDHRVEVAYGLREWA